MTGVMLPGAREWSAVGSETVLAATLVAVLIVPFFVRTAVNRAVGWLALSGVLLALAMTLVPPATGPAFAGLLTCDPAATLWRRVLLTFTAGVIGIWITSTRRAVPAGDGPEFFTLLISATLGLSLMGATSNLLMLLLATELASMPSYVLAGFRKTDRRAAEAALKYVLFGAVCTAAMIYGLSLLYAVGGSLNWFAVLSNVGNARPVVAVGLTLVLVGILFKLAAVPAHFWCPDVFQGAHVDVAAFLSVASKGAGVMLLCRLCTPLASTPAMAVLAIVAVATTTLGNLSALRQSSVKRLLAYSSIAHAGYMLSAMAVLPAGLAAVVIYLVVYAVMNLGAFAILAGIERAAGTDDVSAFDGLNRRAPVAAAAMALCLVGMVGLPPTAGFLAKWKIMAALAGGGGAWWIVVASVAINSVISLAYYARLLRAMYFRPARPDAPPDTAVTVIGITAAVVLVGMLIFFAPLEQWAAGCRFWTPGQTP